MQISKEKREFKAEGRGAKLYSLNCHVPSNQKSVTARHVQISMKTEDTNEDVDDFEQYSSLVQPTIYLDKEVIKAPETRNLVVQEL